MSSYFGDKYRVKYIIYGSMPHSLKLSVGDKEGYLVVDKIVKEHARGEGDKWRCEIHYSNGDIRTIFDLVEIYEEKIDG